MKNIIQIAGVLNEEEARMLLREGADYLGFPLRLNVHREDMSDEQVATLIEKLSISDRSVLITYLNKAEDILALAKKLNVSFVQLHGDISVRQVELIRRQNPSLGIIKSLIVRGDNYLGLKTLVSEFSRVADFFITDSFDPATGASGATGKTHDWRISRRLVTISPLPVILAGGLNADNVRQAILEVHPAGVDVHTGIENADGHKAPNLMRQFVKEARAAFQML